MANSNQARKRIRQNITRRLRNMSQRSKMRTYIKKVRTAIAAGDVTLAQSTYTAAVSVMDKAANKGLIPDNTVARYKSRLNTRIKALAQAAS